MTPSSIVARWNLLLSVGVTLGTAIGGFLVLPPLLAQNAAAWSKFGVFAITLLVGLCLVPMQLYQKRADLRFWYVAAITASVLGIAGFFVYDMTSSAWTFEWRPAVSARPAENGKPEELRRPAEYVVAGAVLSESASEAQRDLAKERGIPAERVTNRDLLLQENGDIVATWPDTSTRQRRLYVLLALYITELFLLAAAVVAVVQATYCVASGDRDL